MCLVFLVPSNFNVFLSVLDFFSKLTDLFLKKEYLLN
jgi:hypothetical protein